MFGSNVSPKKIMKQVDTEDWDCYSCNGLVRYYHSKCPSCGSRRSQDDPHRKGGNFNGNHGNQGSG